jgi:hypothetical protein
VDPAAASVAFVLVGGSDYKTILAEGRGFLGYHVFEAQRVVVLVDLTWL